MTILSNEGLFLTGDSACGPSYGGGGAGGKTASLCGNNAKNISNIKSPYSFQKCVHDARVDIKRTNKNRFGDRQPGLPIVINFLLVIVIYWQKKFRFIFTP